MDIVRLIVLIGLACLIWLDPSWSMPGCRVHKSLIENLGRVLWGTSYGSSAAARRSVDAFGITGDTYWEDNSVCFPSAWPDTCGLPIIVRDLDALPKKGSFRLAALDEVVASFWKFVEHCVQQLEHVNTQLEARSPPSDEQRQVLQTRAACLKEQLARAERLQRNVPFTIYWAADDKREADLKLSFREEQDGLREEQDTPV